VSNRGSIALGELQGKLDLLEIKCHRCERHGLAGSCGEPVQETVALTRREGNTAALWFMTWHWCNNEFLFLLS
jgi:hypothetical protein